MVRPANDPNFDDEFQFDDSPSHLNLSFNSDSADIVVPDCSADADPVQIAQFLELVSDAMTVVLAYGVELGLTDEYRIEVARTYLVDAFPALSCVASRRAGMTSEQVDAIGAFETVHQLEHAADVLRSLARKIENLQLAVRLKGR